MKRTYLRVIGRVALYSSAVLLFAAVFAYFISLPVGYWIVRRFGRIRAWQIVENMFESPAVLPPWDVVYLAAVLAAALTLAAIVVIAYVYLCRKLLLRYGLAAALVFVAVAFGAVIHAGIGGFDILDQWFAVRHEIACRLVRSDFFKRTFHRVDPSSVVFGEKRKNLVVIISESLEERFAEGAVGGENLLPGLVEWRKSRFHADCQCQIAGASGTAPALTAMFYGIPRLRLDVSVIRRNAGRYPRFTVPSVWDVFLTNGYTCAYVQGGTFRFGSKDKLFPEHEAFHKIGFDDLRGDPDYLAEPVKPHFGVNDEVMFRHLRRETARLVGDGRPFVLFALTMNPHNPKGWCSAFAPRGSRGLLAESILAQDRMICDYLRWLEEQPCAADTVVVVVGDHFYWGKKFAGSTPRRVFNAVHVPGAKASPFVRARRFTTLDWAPTFIELAGGRLPGDGYFGSGVSLLRETQTLLEGITESKFDDEMQSSLVDYWDIVLAP